MHLQFTINIISKHDKSLKMQQISGYKMPFISKNTKINHNPKAKSPQIPKLWTCLLIEKTHGTNMSLKPCKLINIKKWTKITKMLNKTQLLIDTAQHTQNQWATNMEESFPSKIILHEHYWFSLKAISQYELWSKP